MYAIECAACVVYCEIAVSVCTSETGLYRECYIRGVYRGGLYRGAYMCRLIGALTFRLRTFRE